MSQIAVRSAKPEPVARLLWPGIAFSRLWRHRDLIAQFTGREAAMRHKGTNLGLAWAVAQPLLMLAVYTFLFGVVFQFRWGRLEGGGNPEFALTFFCGLIVFAVFQECANKSTSLIMERPNLVRRVVFPLEILPAVVLGSALLYMVIEAALLILCKGIFFRAVSPTAFFFPLVLIPLIMLSLGAGWFLSALGVFIRDIRQVVFVCTQMLFFLTPIFYPLDMVPEQYRWFIELNPLTHIVENARRTLLWGMTPDWGSLAVVTVFTAIVMQLGYAWFSRARRSFADVV